MGHNTEFEGEFALSKKNEIIVYQPNETMRLDVRLENESVWLTQSQMGILFGCTTRNIRLHLENIYSCGELTQEATRKDFFLVRQEGDRQVKRNVTCYNLDAIISVGYRVNSVLGVKFRQWATQVLKDYMLRGYAFSQRLNQLEDKMDRRLSKHDQEIVELKDKVDFFVQTSLPPMQGVFYNGQVFDAKVFAAKHILSAKKSILLIDTWVDVVTLELLAKKAKGVTVEIVASHRGNKISVSDIATFNSQYGGLTVRQSRNFHDRFLIIGCDGVPAERARYDLPALHRRGGLSTGQRWTCDGLLTGDKAPDRIAAISSNWNQTYIQQCAIQCKGGRENSQWPVNPSWVGKRVGG